MSEETWLGTANSRHEAWPNTYGKSH